MTATAPTQTPDHMLALGKFLTDRADVRVEIVSDDRFGVDHPTVPIASVPAGRSLIDLRTYLDKYLPHPLQRVGTAKLTTEAAFLAHVERFKSASRSVVFANPDSANPSLTAIYDYHQAGGVEAIEETTIDPGNLKHRAVLALRLSDEWKAWQEIDGEDLTQLEFATFIQDRLADLTLVDDKDVDVTATQELLGARIGGPQSMVSLARGIEVRRNVAVKDIRTLETGEAQVAYEETQTTANGGPLVAPTLFFITIPVFYGGSAYRIPVRVQYRIGSGFTWTLRLYRADKTFDHAFNKVVEKVTTETQVPVFVGAPEQ